MGCGQSSPELAAQAETNRQIAASLSVAKKERDKETKMLLLGTGESGKSTFAKQMRILHMAGFDDAAKKDFKRVIFSNVMENILSLVFGAEKLGIAVADAEACEAIKAKDDYEPEDVLELRPMLERAWNDPGIQTAFVRSDEFQLSDNCDYFMAVLDEITKPDYVPSHQDILRARSKTTGIIETVFTIANITFRMVDVGGQRSERKKWIHCFQDVKAMIFCVSLSEYNQKLDEDQSTARMTESLRLFRQIVTSTWFSETDVILLLNKRDLFQEKITKYPLTIAFPQYTGPNEFGPASEYIEKQFVSQAESSRKIFSHVTCATDSSNIQLVFAAVRQTLLRGHLDDSGI